jgi:hypothetical protein
MGARRYQGHSRPRGSWRGGRGARLADRRQALARRRDSDSDRVGSPLSIRQGSPEGSSYHLRDKPRDELDDDEKRARSTSSLVSLSNDYSIPSDKENDIDLSSAQEYSYDEYQLRAKHNLTRAANDSLKQQFLPATVLSEFTQGNRQASPIPYSRNWDVYRGAPSHRQHKAAFKNCKTNYTPNNRGRKRKFHDGSWSKSRASSRVNSHGRFRPTSTLRRFSPAETLVEQPEEAASNSSDCNNSKDEDEDGDDEEEEEHLIPLSAALASLRSTQAAFCSVLNIKNWAKAPEIVEQDRRRRLLEAYDLKMADPFEVRMRFSGQLQHLNASVVSAQKAAQYAMKHRDMSEDLHSCILEQLEKVCLCGQIGSWSTSIGEQSLTIFKYAELHEYPSQHHVFH